MNSEGFLQWSVFSEVQAIVRNVRRCCLWPSEVFSACSQSRRMPCKKGGVRWKNWHLKECWTGGANEEGREVLSG